MKALKWNVFTDASARRLVVGQGESLCEPWVTSYSFNWRLFFLLLRNSTIGKSVMCLTVMEALNLTMSCCVLSSLRRAGSWFSCQGACGHLQREKEVGVTCSVTRLFACQSSETNSYDLEKVVIFEIFSLSIIKTLWNLDAKREKRQLLISGLHDHMYKRSKSQLKTETYFSQQWPDLQSECREWKRVPNHFLSFCSVQWGASPPPTGFRPQTLGPGAFPVETWSVAHISQAASKISSVCLHF